ncbi:MAG: class I SAM-dependent methyltransferase, partial [Acidimicrobiales bacterium]
MAEPPTPADDWRPRGRLFDEAAGDYQEGRPGYPEAVFRLLQERCGLGPGSQVLEIGPGSGQATLPILGLGAEVTAVEPGAALAGRLRERAGSGRLRIVGARFEDAGLPEPGYDLVVSATAFHWVPPEVGYARAAAALRDHGWLALWWTIFGDPERVDPFVDAFQPIADAKAPGLFQECGVPRFYALDL